MQTGSVTILSLSLGFVPTVSIPTAGRPGPGPPAGTGSIPGHFITTGRLIEQRQPFCAKPCSPPRLVWCPPAPGRRQDAAFLRGPLSRHSASATFPGQRRASPQELRATHTTRRRAPPFPACRFSLFLTASHPRVWTGLVECSRGPGCGDGPGDIATDPYSYWHTGRGPDSLSALPWPLPGRRGSAGWQPDRASGARTQLTGRPGLRVSGQRLRR